MRVTRLLSTTAACAAVMGTLSAAPVAANAEPAVGSTRAAAAAAPSPTGSVSMVAGGFGHGPATSLRAYPTSLAYRDGILYVAERTGPAGQSAATFVRSIDTSTGATSILAGGGSRPLTDLANGPMPATDLQLGAVGGLAMDQQQARLLVGAGNVVAVSTGGNATALTLPTINSTMRCGPCSGQPGARPLAGPADVASESGGSLLLADREVYRVNAAGVTSTLVGGWASVEQTGLRENIPGSVAGANAISVAPDGQGGAYFITKRSATGAPPAVGDAVRRVGVDGVVQTVAQDSSIAVSDPGQPAVARIAGLGSPLLVRAVSDGLLVSTTTGVWHRSISGTWSHVAGGGTTAPADSAAALGTSLAPTSLARDGAGGFFVGTADRVWHVDSSGILHLVEGTGAPYGGDGGQATDATFGSTGSLVRAADGTTYIADSRSHVIRAVGPDGRIRTFAGTGSAVSSGDGGPATDAGFGSVGRLAVDGLGNVYVLDGNAVRKIDSAGTIETVAGNGTTTPDLAGPVSGATTSVVPTDLAAAPDGTLFIAEQSRQRVRKLAPDGTLSTYLDANSTGDGLDVRAIAVDGTTLYFYDGTTHQIWRSSGVDAPTRYATVSGLTISQLAVTATHFVYALAPSSSVVRVNPDGSTQQVVGTVIEDANTRYVDHLTFPVAPIEALTPFAIASDGADGLLGADGSAVWRYSDLGSGTPVPPRPGWLSVIPGNGQLQIRWDWINPSPFGTTGFTVTASPGGASVTVAGTTNSATLTGLANGTTYSVTVQATNAAGTSYPSRAATGTPRAPGVAPSAPTDVAAWPLPNGMVRVAWSTPASSGSGPITEYDVQTPSGTVATYACGSCSLSRDVPAAAGVSATYRVIATSADGSTTSAPSNAVIPSTPVQAPTNVRVIPHNRTSTIVWDAPPATAGHPIVAACASTASGWGTCSAGNVSALNLPSQTPGTQEQVTLQLGNELGVASAAPVSVTTSNMAPPVAPAAVIGVTASATWHGVHVTWTPPAAGSAVRDTVVTLLPEGRSLVIPANYRVADFTGVAPGTTHTVSVTTDGDGGLGPVVTSGTVTVPADPSGLFRPVPQARVYGPQTLTAGTDRDIVIAGHGGIPADAAAVLVNVEVQSPSKAGYLRVTPGGSTSQTAVQEFVAGQTISNLVAVKLGPGGTIRLHLSAGTATVFTDVAGSFTRSGAGDTFLPVSQARVYGPQTLTAGTDRDIVIAGHAGIPADADAVLVNVEVQAATKAGYLRVTPGGSTSQTAVQEFVAGQTISNLVPVKLGPGGTVRLHLSAGAATVFIDVAGAFVSNRPADAYRPVPQARVYGPQKLTAGADRDVVIAGHGGIPTNADAVLVNIEVQAPSKAGYLRVTPGGSTSQTAVQEFTAGQTISALVPVKLGRGGTIRLHLSAGTATIFIDVAGAFTSS